MKHADHKINFVMVGVTVLVTALLLFAGINGLRFETDILKSMPKNDPVIADASYLFQHHPMQDRVVIDLSLEKKDLDLLVSGADRIEEELEESGLFKEVGMAQMEEAFPAVVDHVVETLPLLFTERELRERVLPLLEPEQVAGAMEGNYRALLGLGSIGQARYMERDPLGLRNIVLEKLNILVPTENVQIYGGHLVSGGGEHLLVSAEPAASGTDTAFARRVTELLEKVAGNINEKEVSGDNRFTVTPVGAFRAALDNETFAKRDIQVAITLATIGIALLLLLAFPRPWIGLLSLLPAVFGTITSLFVISLFRDSISLLAVGFGGAVISITVDHGIAYLLFLDRPYTTYGRNASREVRAIGLIAAATTIGAFTFLFLSGFAILAQIGLFAALGILFSFIFVHTVFPVIIPSMAPSRRTGELPLQRFVNRVARGGGKYAAAGALVFAAIMLFFARPDFRADLASMNTVSGETLAAEKLVASVWGDIFSRVYLMAEEPDIGKLQSRSDALLDRFEEERDRGVLSSYFLPSVVFPGEDRARENLTAWKEFWTGELKGTVRRLIGRESRQYGFAPDAFRPFFDVVNSAGPEPREIPEKLYGFLNIAESGETGTLMLFSTVVPGDSYHGEDFFRRYSRDGAITIYDGRLFAKKMGELISSSFMKMMIVIGISVLLLLLLFFLDVRVTAISLVPIVFALVATLGTKKLIGHPFDIPSLMLSIVILGMGIDYSLYFVRSHQRYVSGDSPLLGIIRLAVFLASMSTLIGFGSLAMAEHTLLRSAGVTSLLGIGYSLVGAFALMPPLCGWYFARDGGEPAPAPDARGARKNVLRRYRKLEPYPRLFARFKTGYDSMFPKLEELVVNPKLILDVGCGYGVPSAWLLERHRDARVTAMDPDPERVRVASLVFGSRGTAVERCAPGLPEMAESADTVLMIDMVHYLTNGELAATLKNVRFLMAEGGTLYIRATIPGKKNPPFLRRIEELRLAVSRRKPRYRTGEEIEDCITAAGLSINRTERCHPDREEIWFIAGKG